MICKSLQVTVLYLSRIPNLCLLISTTLFVKNLRTEGTYKMNTEIKTEMKVKLYFVFYSCVI